MSARLHRRALSVMMLGSLAWLAIYTLKSSPSLVEPARIRCAPSVRELSMWDQERTPASGSLEAWRVISWDLSVLPKDREVGIFNAQVRPTLEASLRAATPRRPVAVMIQGASAHTQRSLEALMLTHGGCWGSASTSPRTRLGRALERAGWPVYQSLLGPHRSAEASEERALWTGVSHVDPSAQLYAERWALPERPGRWPQRWFYLRPAALAFAFESSHDSSEITTRRLVNLKLPDAVNKHQAGALALRALQRAPLMERLGSGWLIAGDWRVTPPNTPRHPTEEFRFQRFSLEALYADPKLHITPPLGASPELWGRWRPSTLRLDAKRGHQPNPAIIDHALTDTGSLKLIPTSGPWIGDYEARAPLIFDWRSTP